MTDFSRLVSVIQIENIRLCESQSCCPVQPSEIPSAVEVNTSRGTSVVKEPGEDGRLMINTNFSLEIVSEEEHEKRTLVKLSAVFELSYLIPPGTEVFSSGELEAFGQINAVFNAWPYWREFAQSNLTRMSMPAIVMPVYRLPQRKQKPETEESPPEIPSEVETEDSSV